MTAELWLEKPCEHGKTSEHLRATCLDLHPNDRSHFKQCWCPGGSRVRLDPDKVKRIQVSAASGSYGPKHVIDSSDLIFVDMDYEMATTLAPGTYLVIGIDALEEE